MYFKHGILQHDISIGNILICQVENKIFASLIDFDYAKKAASLKAPLLGQPSAPVDIRLMRHKPALEENLTIVLSDKLMSVLTKIKGDKEGFLETCLQIRQVDTSKKPSVCSWFLSCCLLSYFFLAFGVTYWFFR